MVKLVKKAGLHIVAGTVLGCGIGLCLSWTILAALEVFPFWLLFAAEIAPSVMFFSRKTKRPFWVVLMTVAACGFYIGIVMIAVAIAGEGIVSFGARTAVLGGMALLVAAASAAFFLTRNFVSLRVVECTIEGLPTSLDGFTIAHISDMHIHSAGDKGLMDSAVSLINKNSPDIVCISGDQVDDRGDEVYKTAPVAAEILGRIQATYGVFAVLGNHDIKAGADEVRRSLSESVRVLDYEAEVVETASGARVCVAGVEGPETWWERSLREPAERLHRLAEHLPTVSLRILISHFPETVDYMPYGSFDLVVSGHMHGGQIGLGHRWRSLNLGRLVGRYVLGIYRVTGTVMNVTAGVGSSYYLPLRIGVWPEVAIITLRAPEGSG